MRTSERIPRTTETLEQRGIPAHSYFAVVFRDGSEADERDVRWTEISREESVHFFEGRKTVRVCTYDVARISALHDGLSASIDVPEGSEVYQAIRSRATISHLGQRNEVVGRVIGVVRDGVIMEEQFLNGLEHSVFGTKI